MDKLPGPYVLISPAYNEEKYIAKTLSSVVSQTILPLRWVIISDGSTDRTDEIIRSYLEQHEFIQYIRREKGRAGGNFASKVSAFNLGYRSLEDSSYAFIGNLDADVSFEPDYFEKILSKFADNERLGIAGGRVFEESNEGLRHLSFDDTNYVSGRIQLFRRECYQAIGGYRPAEKGGEDTIAVVMARMHGWECNIFSDLKILHHKKSATARGSLRESFRDGAKDYGLGSHPLFQAVKCCNRIRQKPYLLGAFARAMGYLWQFLCRVERPVDKGFIRFFRGEQKNKLQRLLWQVGKRQ